MRVLIYGAGVIGSFYAALLSESGIDVTIYARGRRLSELMENGLQYHSARKVKKANIKVIDKLSDDDCYDYIFLTVRAEQLHTALDTLKANKSPTIVTMVNSIEDYEVWESIVGKGRILPAFPGAGGGFENGVLNAKLTPGLIQPTTFGEISGERSQRVQSLKRMLKGAKIPCQIVSDMHAWQLCHLAMVVPLADAYYMTDGEPEKVSNDKRVMKQTAKQLRNNFYMLKHLGISISPVKMNIFRFLPLWLLRFILGRVYRSHFADIFMYRHAMKAKEEMHTLHTEFYDFLQRRRLIE